MPRMDAASTRLSAVLRKGRGAVSNAAGRFDATTREGFDDGWDHEEEITPLRRDVLTETPRTIIARNTSPDIPFDRSVNAYRGCEHGCIYCFARPTHAYLGLSAGLDFETKLTVKPGAARLLRKGFDNPRYTPAPLALGTNTDPYQPLEKEYRITRSILEVLLAYRHPFSITTKSAMVVRDGDLLAEAAALGLVHVALSITTLDHRLARLMEPRASTPQRRLWAIERLSSLGVPCSVMAAPMIPALTDHEMEGIISAAVRCGARQAQYIPLRMPHEIKDLFGEWLETHFPDRKARVLRYVRETHGGKDYDPQWGTRLRGTGPYAALMGARFEVIRKKLALEKHPPQRRDLFRRPPRKGDQLSLFGS